MSQATLDDDELFSEAATDIRADVEEALKQARAALPAADAIWTVEAENTLGVLNSLRSALDTGDAADHLREAKKWYTMGERAGAFEDDELEEEIELIESLFERIDQAHEESGELAATLPDLRGDLEGLGAGAGDED